MFELIKQYKPFLIFLLGFFGSYLILVGLYKVYLSQYDVSKFEPDGMTTVVSEQANWLTNLFGERSRIEQSALEPAYNAFINQKQVARIIEGCNALSVMILFSSFIIGFRGPIKNTLWYILFGVFLIHIFNVLRISLITLGLFYFPEHRKLLHDYLFPLFIYGVVFLLWLLWVNKFSYHAKK
jgi:exosortase family protein XrtF